MDETDNSKEIISPKVHPIIEAMGKENAALNAMLPQTGLVYHDIGIAAVMFNELKKTGISWQEFFEHVPHEKILNEHMVKAYRGQHHHQDLAVHEMGTKQKQGSLFTYPTHINVSMFIQNGLVPFLNNSNIPNNILGDQTYTAEGAPAIHVINKEELMDISSQEVYDKFLGIMTEIENLLDSQKYVKIGILIRESIGQKGLENNNFRERLLNAALTDKALETALRQEGPQPDKLDNASLEVLFNYYDKLNLFEDRYDFSSKIVKESFQFFAGKLKKYAEEHGIPDKAALSIFNIQNIAYGDYFE